MRWLHQLRMTVRSVIRSRAIDRELGDEMRFHIERETEANIARGMSAYEAHRAARMLFGSVDNAHEQSRDERPGVNMRDFSKDIRFGLHLLAKNRGFAFAAVMIIGLAIGAASSVFSVVNGVLLQPLPFGEPERLVRISILRGPQQQRVPPTAADVMDLRQLTQSFDGVAMMRDANLNLTGRGEPQRLQGLRVSANYFNVLGVRAQLGRTFATDEELAGNERVVIIGDALWRSRFGADSALIGQTIQLDGGAYTVVGVMPDGVSYPSKNYQTWVPLVVAPQELTRQILENYRVVARLKSGVSITQAQSQITELATRLSREFGDKKVQGAGMGIDLLLDDAVRDIRAPLNLLMGAVAFLIALACVNLASLFAARATARKGEFALRLALGASRQRIMRQAAAEALPLIVVGGAVGLLLAQWAIRLLVAAAPSSVPRLENVSISAPVALVTMLMLALTGIAVTLAPVVQAWRADFATITRDGGRASTTGKGRMKARRVGVATQIALAIPLLVGASLMVRSAVNLSRVDIGFDPTNVASISFEVSRSKHQTDAQAAGYYSRILDAVSEIPGVQHAAITNRVPFLGLQSNSVRFETPGVRKDDFADIDSRTVSPDFFTTLGIQLVEGRVFTDADNENAPYVAIIDERIAKQYWPNESAIGKRFAMRNEKPGEIIGVVRHTRTMNAETDLRSQVYWSYRQWVQNRMVLALRMQNSASSAFAPAIAAIRSIDPDQSVYEVRTLDNIVSASKMQRRLTTVLIGGFSLAALLLSAVGVYGVITYGVTQRVREFGIRTALGATSQQISGLVIRQGALLAGAGVAAGLVLAVATVNLARSLVYGVAPTDVVSLVGATVLMLSIACIASYLPARRAAKVHPASIMRGD